MASKASSDGPESASSAIRVMGKARGSVPEGADYSVWLLQVDDGDPYLAVGGGGQQFQVRFALTGEVLPDQGLVSKARTAIARHHARDVVVTAERDEDGVWCAQAILAPGIAAHGNGETRQAAVDDCNDALDLLIDELRADT